VRPCAGLSGGCLLQDADGHRWIVGVAASDAAARTLRDARHLAVDVDPDKIVFAVAIDLARSFIRRDSTVFSGLHGEKGLRSSESGLAIDTDERTLPTG